MHDFDIEANRAPFSAQACVRGALRDVGQWRLDGEESPANRVREHEWRGFIEAAPLMSMEKAVPPALATGLVAGLFHQDATALAV